ncbi:hypothetical protein [Helicobacter jaachi]|uniref:hypothetical protein n=1 Tax=Helicobacter jaachi TaxID=1677920 RepID=UPI0005144260|nr:hypothetical protein [Helicobacter jaachi]
MFYVIKSCAFSYAYVYAKVFLIVASLCFYGFFKWTYLPILLLSIGVNYLIAKKILSYRFSFKAMRFNGGGGEV